MALVARAPDGFMTIGCATARRRTLQVRGRAIAGTHKLTPRFIEKWSACSTRTACRWEPMRLAIAPWTGLWTPTRSEEHTSELQSRGHLVCRLLLEKKKRSADRRRRCPRLRSRAKYSTVSFRPVRQRTDS